MIQKQFLDELYTAKAKANKTLDALDSWRLKDIAIADKYTNEAKRKVIQSQIDTLDNLIQVYTDTHKSGITDKMNLTGRKVQAKKWIPSEYDTSSSNRTMTAGTNCWEKGFSINGIFHQWQYVQATEDLYAIIELSDGSIILVESNKLRFMPEETVSQDKKPILTYDQWLAINEKAITLELAESGADRELGFDLEAEYTKRYELYDK